MFGAQLMAPIEIDQIRLNILSSPLAPNWMVHKRELVTSVGVQGEKYSLFTEEIYFVEKVFFYTVFSLPLLLHQIQVT
jgi:hypothetical protein